MYMYTHVYCSVIVFGYISSAVIIVGFPYKEMTFNTSAVGNATMLVFGDARQSFTVNYVHGMSL